MIWLIGCKGMLGQELALLLEKRNMPFTGTDSETDITDKNALTKFTHGKKISWVINCAAYTAVDKAEDDEDICRRLNAAGAANIAETAQQIGARFIHISTDYVFDGRALCPYKEEDAPNPIGVYGRTKRNGEEKVLMLHKSPYIIRTAWLYGKQGNNFVRTMLRLMTEKESLNVVNDQKGTPTWARDLASVIITLIEKNKIRPLPPGFYHFTDRGECTWFEFARAIYDEGRKLNILTKECQILPCTSGEFPAKVKRPLYSVLDKSKISAALNVTIPFWEESLKNCLTEIKDEYRKTN
ncbi:dTDP-4-dehydrorhamnose reductase [Breznakiellaceae bacterium SP9]